MRKLISIFVFALLLTNLVKAQNSIDDFVNSYAGENAVPYVQPLADIFTSSINTGVWDWSTIDRDFYLRIKLQGMVSFPTQSMRTFSGRTTGDFRPVQTAIVPTIIGDERSVVLHGDNNSIYVFPGGLDLQQVILGTPQITVGGFLNSEVTARFLAFPLNDNLDRVRFYGIGARHSISNYFNDSPIDLSIGYMYHHTEAGNYINSDQHLVSAHIGKTGKILSGQFMVGYQASNSDLHYVYDDGDTQTEVNLNLTNQNPFIMEAGLGVKLGPLMASSSISYSEHVAVAAGLGLFF
ncbi:MAG TPA: DUF6588 family protein [Saprospiraceae bacterium]|nr:DUF6588 family protein [Saprospiraceae bacterium]